MIRRLRLTSGLVMLGYMMMHLANRALGLVSLDAMEQTLLWVVAIWSQYPMLALLFGAFLVHYLLALWALWQRGTLRLRFSELLQLVLGFASSEGTLRSQEAGRLVHRHRQMIHRKPRAGEGLCRTRLYHPSESVH
jgi:hypothetical protein